MTKWENIAGVKITPTLQRPSDRGQLRREMKAHAPEALREKRNARSVEVRAEPPRAEQDLLALPLKPRPLPKHFPRVAYPPAVSDSRRRSAVGLEHELQCERRFRLPRHDRDRCRGPLASF